MYRKHYFILLVAAALFLSSGAIAYAQNGQLRGRVVSKQADGKEEPVSGAVIDVFRSDDFPGKWNTKTDKSGNFVFAGLPYSGTYIISASAPNTSPNILTGVKAGRDVDFKVILEPGDGRRFTEAEAKNFAGGKGPAAGTTSETPETRAEREEKLAKNKEIQASNEKAEEINAVARRTFEAGGKALQAKNYDEAIKQYDEGLAADPEQAALLTNKSIALRNRGVERYNAAVQSKEQAARDAGIASAKKDFSDAAAASTKAVELIKAESAATDPAQRARQTANKNAALVARADAMRLFVPKVDPTKADEGQAAFKDYIETLTDPAAKLKVQLEEAQMLFDAGAVDKAVVEYEQILKVQPDNVDALLGAGLALFGAGDTTKYQEAANYLQRFVDSAPDTHPLKADAKAVIEDLKKQDVKPQKPTGKRRG